ncbi:MAG TPA: hypothetical protein VEW07_03980 [Solirubrobacterales bacterium]|nr:hypothetical protein [Solirubrobacterales bacterium]
MRVALGKLACSGLKTHLGDDLVAGTRKALFHYARKLKAGRGPLAPPRFLDDIVPEGSTVAFDLTVDPKTEAVLEQEALRQRTTIGRLAAHTVLVYLAELEFLSAPGAGRDRYL